MQPSRRAIALTAAGMLLIVVASCGGGGAGISIGDAGTGDGGDAGTHDATVCVACDAATDAMQFGGDGSVDATSCTPTTCKQAGFNCGMNPDGCNHILVCGTCTPPAFCGGGGFSVCGVGDGGTDGSMDGSVTCVPKTCQGLGFNCGPAGDGCGGMLACGTCVSPQTCGGAGMPSVCGTPTPPCTNLCLKQVTCDAGGTTSITGTVVAGTQAPFGSPDPVPNVLVYVPNGAVKPFTTGVQCSQCGADVTGNPLVQATTDYTGSFTLSNVPVTTSMPLVIQLGRWRRQLTIPTTTACTSIAVGPINMPRVEDANDDIPLTAVSTGSVDPMECVLYKMGVDASQFSLPGGTGRIQLYEGNGASLGAATPPETALTTSPSALAGYDQVIFPCWGEDPRAGGANVKTPAEQANVIGYTSAGGRVFATHFSYAWLYDDAPFSGSASFIADDVFDTATAVIQQSPADVAIFYQWMNFLGPANNGATGGQFTILQPRNDFSAITPSESALWVNATNPLFNGMSFPPPTFPVLYTFDTPIAPDAGGQCGKVIFSDFHVAVVQSASPGCGGTGQLCCAGQMCAQGLTCDTSGPPAGWSCVTTGLSFPAECSNVPMTAQEKALEYLIWDLASCVPPPPATGCTPITCGEQNIACGPAGDGCGGLLQCGNCTPPATCGGGGQYGQCGTSTADGGSHCTPRTCAGQGLSCGYAGDGCGDVLNCGSCTPPQTCGGGGSPGLCGGGNQ